ncbi:MAG: hypothetical protein M1816_004821 [Peltula sp. TS41687]|nr:MAG: hypothetical protein M1816_004821 [Peltula sp. TS41687]
MDENTRHVEEIRWGLSSNGFALRQPSPAASTSVPGEARFDVPTRSWSPYNDGQPQPKRISKPPGGQRTELKNFHRASQILPVPAVGISTEDGHLRPDAPPSDQPPMAGPRGLKRKADSDMSQPTPSLAAVKVEAGSSLRASGQHVLDSVVASTEAEKSPSPQEAHSAVSRETTENASPGGIPSRPRRVPAKGAGEDEANGPRKAVSAIRGMSHEIPRVLPHESVFPIQIGCELFRLSGASISSDAIPTTAPAENPGAPSYFSQFFERELQKNGGDGGRVRTLYIDRDPFTFRDISRHLQGYYVQPRDGTHFVKLFADAQFYSLPRLTSQLFESDVFIQIGGRDFRISRDVFSGPGDSPNFFTLGFAISFSTPNDIFPGLKREGLLRPPSVSPPCVLNRSAEVFAELLHLLKGYPLHIRDAEHREALLRDCRYFYFRGLEQKLIAHRITFNPERDRTDILMGLDDIRSSGISIRQHGPGSGHWISYARPFVDDPAHELIIEIGGNCTTLDLRTMQATFHGSERIKLTSLCQNVFNQVDEPRSKQVASSTEPATGSSAVGSMHNSSVGRFGFEINEETSIRLDGGVYEAHRTSQGNGHEPGQNDHRYHKDVQAEAARPRHPHMTISESHGQNGGRTRQAGTLDGTSDLTSEWIVQTGQWRLRIQKPAEIMLVAVKLDAHSGEGAWNARRSFLRL